MMATFIFLLYLRFGREKQNVSIEENPPTVDAPAPPLASSSGHLPGN